jgi:hemoglobin-like flavoprotein
MPVHRHPASASKVGEPITRIPVDAGVVERLRTSYKAVRLRELDFARIFYAKLFEAAPGVRSMFPADLELQSRKLTMALDTIVANLENPETNSHLLAEMGRRHAGYGARPEHYHLVIETMIAAMREVLGANADERVLDEWRMALRLIGKQMIDAAR